MKERAVAVALPPINSKVWALPFRDAREVNGKSRVLR
jgi:hypothetical protein